MTEGDQVLFERAHKEWQVRITRKAKTSRVGAEGYTSYLIIFNVGPRKQNVPDILWLALE